ncbi:histidine-rich glycoprotein-like [Phymastichus coffea]|uniref:histidine-rich glycoprotein-like n=1 Tax=Phymastichus coffea TaxID=108790 RepID=UPI00273AE83D|nr:histidine-rich glycoprotein-like [Phymastichus coffea]
MKQVARMLFLVMLLVYATANPVKQVERMVIAKMRMSDQDGSETGYAYEQQHGAPVSFVQYTTHTGSSAGLPYEGDAYAPSHDAYPFYQTYGDYDVPLPPYYPQAYLVPPPPSPAVPAIVEPYSHGHYHQHPHGDDGDEESFEEAGGTDHNAQDNLVHGEKGEKDYGSFHSRDEADNVHHEADHNDGEYKNEAGHQGGHEETDTRFDSHDKSEVGQQGTNYGNKSYQKKGHRVTGFHNVYHKDEYKKDTDFYDEDHDGGHYEKYGAYDAHHTDEAGGYEKDGKHDAGYDFARRGQQGHFEKGHDVSSKHGHKGAQGKDSYRQHHADYDSTGGKRYASQHGYKQGHGYR